MASMLANILALLTGNLLEEPGNGAGMNLEEPGALRGRFAP